MRKRSFKKAPKATGPLKLGDGLEKALRKQAKERLVEVIMEIAREDHETLRELELQFDVEAPAKELIASTVDAIADATDFDEREMNHNFDYDYAAYESVKRNFARLIKLGNLRQAMELSLELMRHGSYQVEMSDEGLMTEDIADCLNVVISALKKATIPPAEVTAWCDAMSKKDRVGFICDKELKSLRKQFEAPKPK